LYADLSTAGQAVYNGLVAEGVEMEECERRGRRRCPAGRGPRECTIRPPVPSPR
jgi:hypothetical protein